MAVGASGSLIKGIRTIQSEWRLIVLAIGFFTRIPMPAVKNFKEADLNHASKYFPLIGIAVGMLAALVYSLSIKYFPLEIAVIFSMLATICMTGCLHEDGLADSADGLGGHLDKEQALIVMQDSRVGSYGVVALFFVLLTKFYAIVNLATFFVPLVLVAGHALSRYAALLVMVSQRYVRPAGKSKPFTGKLGMAELVLASLFGVLPLCWLPPQFLWALLPVVLVWIWFSLTLKKRLGGYSGDCLGAMQQLTEVSFYLGIVAAGYQ